MFPTSQGIASLFSALQSSKKREAEKARVMRSDGTVAHRWNVLRVVLPEDFLFFLLFWAFEHERIILRHWLSDETHGCVTETLRFIIPVGSCSPQSHFYVGCFQIGHKGKISLPVSPPPPPHSNPLSLSMNTTTRSSNIQQRGVQFNYTVACEWACADWAVLAASLPHLSL